MENQTLNNLKSELIEKFAKDGIDTIKTVAALVGVDKDFGNGKVAVTYLPLLTIYTTKDDKDGGTAFFVGNCDIGQHPKSGVFTTEQVEQWRSLRKELFGDAPKGVLKSLLRWEERPEVNAWLMNVSKIGLELNKALRVSRVYSSSK